MVMTDEFSNEPGWIFLSRIGRVPPAAHHAGAECGKRSHSLSVPWNNLLTTLPTTPDAQTIATLTPARVAATRSSKPAAA